MTVHYHRIDTIDRTAQRYWEVASAWRQRLDLKGIQNVQHALMAAGILITIESDGAYRPTRRRQLVYLYELHNEMIVGQKRNRAYV